jgi:hypothetical protein
MLTSCLAATWAMLKIILATLREAEELLKAISNEDDRQSLAADIAEERRLIEEYLKRR